MPDEVKTFTLHEGRNILGYSELENVIVTL